MNINEYIPHAKSLIMYRGLDIEEHLGAAYEGLVRASRNYQPGRVKFWTFAQKHVLGAISDYRRSLAIGSRRMRVTGRVPVHVSVHENIPEKEGFKSDIFEHLCQSLDSTDKLIVKLRYKEDLTLFEIGRAIGLSESRISQRHSFILKLFKERLQCSI